MRGQERFDQLVEEAIAQSFSGWDFAFVEDRLEESGTSWDYQQLTAQRIGRATALLDMCTGGGEFLDAFETLPDLTYATEGFTPNIEVAKSRLERRGVEVVPFTSDDELPLPSDTFDLVINRHGAYSPKELVRITTPQAVFLTQQVGSDNASGINQALDTPPTGNPREWCLEVAIEGLVANGFTIGQSAEEFPEMSFYDIGALVYYLKAIPWQIPGFDPQRFKPELFALHQHIEKDGVFRVQAHRFLIEASRTL